MVGVAISVVAAGVFASWGLVLRPEMAALSMSGSSVIVAVNEAWRRYGRAHGAEIVADVQGAGGRDAGEDAGHKESLVGGVEAIQFKVER